MDPLTEAIIYFAKQACMDYCLVWKSECLIKKTKVLSGERKVPVNSISGIKRDCWYECALCRITFCAIPLCLGLLVDNRDYMNA
jgi:hypothetical protein